MATTKNSERVYNHIKKRKKDILSFSDEEWIDI